MAMELKNFDPYRDLNSTTTVWTVNQCQYQKAALDPHSSILTGGGPVNKGPAEPISYHSEHWALVPTREVAN